MSILEAKIEELQERIKELEAENEVKEDSANIEIQIWNNKYNIEHHFATCQERLVKEAATKVEKLEAQIELIENQCQENGHNAAMRLLKIEELEADNQKLIEGQKAKTIAGSGGNANEG